MNTPTSLYARHLLCMLTMLLSLTLGGCAVFTPPRAYTSEAEVLAERGQPTARWPNPDGSTVLEFSTQPYGTTCLMVEIDASGAVRRQWNALAEDNLARVKPGMTQDEVRRLLGQYRSVQRFALSGEEVWDWNIPKESIDLIATYFNVHFADGKVVRTSRTHEYPRDGWLMGRSRGGGYWVGPWGPYWHPRWGYLYPHPFWGWGW